jgi:nucleoside-diphosphate-sugar epimerase
MRENTILVTGATGFLGGAFIAKAFSESGAPDARYVLSARGASEEDSRARIRLRLTRFVGEQEAERIVGLCQVLCIDFSKPDTIEHPVLDEVTHVVHLAANTSFISGAGVWETNHQGTMALAKRVVRSPKLQRFVYVGTAMICGDEPPHQVLEDMYPSSSAAHLVDYTASKAAAEQGLLHEVPGLPLVIARPSIVIGDTKLGCGPSGSIFWVFRALDKLGIVSVDPEQVGIDVVPVDWVAEGLWHLMKAEKLAHRIYHLSAGKGSRSNLEQLARAFAAAQGLTYMPGRLERMRTEDLRNYRPRIAEVFGKVHGRRMEISLALYLGFCELDVTFDNSRILAEGVPPPPPLPEYVAACLNNPKDISIVQQAADEL